MSLAVASGWEMPWLDVEIVDVLEDHRPAGTDADGPPALVHHADADVFNVIWVFVYLVEPCAETRQRRIGDVPP